MILEAVLDILAESILPILLPIIVILCGIFFGVYLLCKKVPNKFTRALLGCVRIFAPTWIVLFAARLAVCQIGGFYIGGYPLALIDLLVTPICAIGSLILAGRALWRFKGGKVCLMLTALCLAATVLTDTVVFFVMRYPANVYEEIYYALRDADFPWKSKAFKVKSFEFYYPDDIFSDHVRDERYVSGEYCHYTMVFCRNNVRICSIHEAKKLIFCRQKEIGGDYAMYEYDLDAKELSYSCSGGDTGARDPFLDDILVDWYAGLGQESKFRVWDPGKYADVGYREADGYIYELVVW